MSTISSLAQTLLQLTSQTQSAATANPAPADSLAQALQNTDGSGGDPLADSLNLSHASIADLEQQAQQIANQNRSSALATPEAAFAANLAAVAALAANPAQAQAGQASPDSASVYSLVNG
jgi:hypothetical protein